MIKKIIMNNVASYKHPATLETEKRVNLIYGLNGSGKSTLSDFLYHRAEIDFSNCCIEPAINENTKILVYNQTFIKDNFYTSKALPGIFSLSEGNKEAQEKIDLAREELRKLDFFKSEIEQKCRDNEQRFGEQKNIALNKIWEIKQQYTGGDRVLDFCLDGLNRSKEKPFEYILNIQKPEEKPLRTIEQLKQDIQLLNSMDVPISETIKNVDFSASFVEHDPIFSKIIVGSSNSSISGLIKQLSNQNWVQDGLVYIENQGEDKKRCPFCQQETITKEFIADLKSFFSVEYEQDRKNIENLGKQYSEAIKACPFVFIEAFDRIDIIRDLKDNYIASRDVLLETLNKNLDRIREKWRTPNIEIKLQDSSEALNSVNDILEKARLRIQNFNEKIAQKKQALGKLKDEFWEINRWEYDQTIYLYESNKKQFVVESLKNQDIIKKINDDIRNQKDIIVEEQRKVVNIQEAIDHINSNLLAIGIDHFRLEPFRDNLYQISREGQTEDIFPTLSEGEKMIISFLYFLELCNGKQLASEDEKKKIIVIDDPISSLSHVYIFNIGQLIKNEFFNKTISCQQIFVLTHSLYFFYELFSLAKPKSGTQEERRIQTPKRIRIYKNSSGSNFSEITSNEIQNDYQAYWLMIKDDKTSPALLANCMRNILEYFFGFVENIELSNIFSRTAFGDNKFQAFVRYMDVESHSRMHIVFDFKEFDYDVFQEAFHLVFKEADYEKHYTRMMGLRSN